MERAGEAILSTGQYAIVRVVLEPDSRLVVPNTNGDVDVRDEFVYRGAVTTAADGGRFSGATVRRLRGGRAK